jgi:hypothetical protein
VSQLFELKKSSVSTAACAPGSAVAVLSKLAHEHHQGDSNGKSQQHLGKSDITGKALGNQSDNTRKSEQMRKSDDTGESERRHWEIRAATLESNQSDVTWDNTGKERQLGKSDITAKSERRHQSGGTRIGAAALVNQSDGNQEMVSSGAEGGRKQARE